MPEISHEFASFQAVVKEGESGTHLVEILDLTNEATYQLPIFPYEITELIDMLQTYRAALEAESAQKDLEREMRNRGIDDVRGWWTR